MARARHVWCVECVVCIESAAVVSFVEWLDQVWRIIVPHTCIINTLVLSRLLGPALHCSTYTSSSYPNASHIFCIPKVYCSRMIKFYYITSLLLLLLFLTIIFKGVKPESDSTPALLLTLSACSQLGAAQSVWFSPPCLSSRDPTFILYLLLGFHPPYIVQET